MNWNVRPPLGRSSTKASLADVFAAPAFDVNMPATDEGNNVRMTRSEVKPLLRRTYDPAQLLGRNFLCSGYIWNPVEARLSDDKGARVLVVDRLVLFHLPSRTAGTLLSHLYVRQCLTRRAMSENRSLVSKEGYL